MEVVCLALALPGTGSWYLHGIQVDLDWPRAVVLLKEAAEQNIPDALYAWRSSSRPRFASGRFFCISFSAASYDLEAGMTEQHCPLLAHLPI